MSPCQGLSPGDDPCAHLLPSGSRTLTPAAGNSGPRRARPSSPPHWIQESEEQLAPPTRALPLVLWPPRCPHPLSRSWPAEGCCRSSEPLTKIKPVSSVLQPVSPRPFSGVCSVSIAPPQARGSGGFAPGVILTCLAHVDRSHASLRVGPKAPRCRDATLTSQPSA